MQSRAINVKMYVDNVKYPDTLLTMATDKRQRDTVLVRMTRRFDRVLDEMRRAEPGRLLSKREMIDRCVKEAATKRRINIDAA